MDEVLYGHVKPCDEVKEVVKQKETQLDTR